MHPGAFSISLLAAGIIWVPIGVAIFALVGWIIQGEVDALVGILGIAISIGMGACAFISPDPLIAPLLFVVMVSTLVLFPLGRTMRERREHALIDVDQIERAYSALEKNPQDVGAKIKIAKMLQRRGDVGHAVELAEAALKAFPKDMFDEEHRMINMWKRGGFFQVVPLVCVRCGAKNRGGVVWCYRCKAPIMLHFAKGHWVDPAIMRRILLGWMACVIPIVGIPVAATSLTPAKSGPVVVILLCASAVVGWIALRGWNKATV